MEKLEDQKIIDALKTVFDTEIPVDIYELERILSLYCNYIRLVIGINSWLVSTHIIIFNTKHKRGKISFDCAGRRK